MRLSLKVPRNQPRSGKHPNLMLFVVYPLVIFVSSAAVGLIAGLLAKAHAILFYAFISITLIALIWTDLRRTVHAKYEVSETPGRNSQWRVLREAWRLPKFRVAVAKGLVFSVELVAIAALVAVVTRYARNAL